MNIFNFLGILLLTYFAMYAAYRAGKYKLKLRKTEESLKFSENKSMVTSTNHWTKMIICLILCFVSIALVFKIIPNLSPNSAVQSSKITDK